VKRLEAEIDELNAGLPALTSFVLPGGGPVGAALHEARTVCRRAERAVTALARKEPVGDRVLPYLNRLSDLLFVLSRWARDIRPRARDALGPGPELTKRDGALALLALGLAALSAAPRSRSASPEIEIRTSNVFRRPRPPRRSFRTAWPTSLHGGDPLTASSKKYLLLFGRRPLDPERLAETERNLRGTGLFRYVLVRAIGTKVVVRRGDCLDAPPSRFAVEQGRGDDLLGRRRGGKRPRNGRQLKFLYDRGTERISRSFTFVDPAFLRRTRS